VGLYTLHPVELNPVVSRSLKGAWFQPLSLSSEKLVSKFGFQMRLVPLQLGQLKKHRRVRQGVVACRYGERCPLAHPSDEVGHGEVTSIRRR
jgi:hypothetical protein